MAGSWAVHWGGGGAACGGEESKGARQAVGPGESSGIQRGVGSSSRGLLCMAEQVRKGSGSRRWRLGEWNQPR